MFPLRVLERPVVAEELQGQPTPRPTRRLAESADSGSRVTAQSRRRWLLAVLLRKELGQLRQPKQIFIRKGDRLEDESGRGGVPARRLDERSRTLAEWRRMLKRTFSSKRSTRWIFTALWDKKARDVGELANGLERALKRGRY